MSPRTLLSILASPSRANAGNFSEPPGTTSGAPLRRDFEVTEAPCTRKHKDSTQVALRPMFLEDVAQKARNRRSELETRHFRETIPRRIAPPAICGLRLAPTSGISATMELWPSG